MSHLDIPDVQEETERENEQVDINECHYDPGVHLTNNEPKYFIIYSTINYLFN